MILDCVSNTIIQHFHHQSIQLAPDRSVVVVLWVAARRETAPLGYSSIVFKLYSL